MDTKLTLKLDKEIIERAKLYARNNNTSLSKLIENMLSRMTSSNEDDVKITPLVESLSGIINPKEIDDYSDYLAEKYK